MILAPTVSAHELHFLTNTRGWKDQDAGHRSDQQGYDFSEAEVSAGDVAALEFSNSVSAREVCGSFGGESSSSLDFDTANLQLSGDDISYDSPSVTMPLHVERAILRAVSEDDLVAASSIATAAAEMYKGQLEALTCSKLTIQRVLRLRNVLIQWSKRAPQRRLMSQSSHMPTLS